MRVEEKPRPVRCGDRSRHEVSDGDRIVDDERLLLPGQRRVEFRIGASVHLDGKAPRLDTRTDLDRYVQGRGADLLEPEAVLVDEVEGEPIAARRPWGRDGQLELDRRTWLDDVRERGPRAAPHDGVAERIEPVVGELDSFLA